MKGGDIFLLSDYYISVMGTGDSIFYFKRIADWRMYGCCETKSAWLNNYCCV